MPHPLTSYLVVDDHPAFQLGVIAALQDAGEFVCVAKASNASEAIGLYKLHQPDLVLMDLRLPDMSGADCARAIQKIDGKAKVVILTSYETDEEVANAVTAGVKGYLLKDTPLEKLVMTLRDVMKGHRCISHELHMRIKRFTEMPKLAPRELETLRALSQGLSNKEIADLLGVSLESVKTFIKRMFLKLDVLDRTQAVTKAIEMGLLKAQK
jgi:two-component system, NarL family, response regulator